jgi:predicted DsbA family dithiol-disulfide isomerase
VEIHPETPTEGMPMIERFRAEDISRMMEHLRTMGAAFGITFVDRPFLSNSRLALQAAEFARDAGMFEVFHEAVFAAYFSHGLNIGMLEVIKQIGQDCGLDVEALVISLQSGKYLPKLREAQDEATSLGVTGVPRFFIGDKKSIVGAQPLDVFRKTLSSIAE